MREILPESVKFKLQNKAEMLINTAFLAKNLMIEFAPNGCRRSYTIKCLKHLILCWFQAFLYNQVSRIQVLFRGKDVNSNEWRIGYFYTAVQGCVAIIGDGIDGYQVKPETVGQYTGLTDKNGRRIFEGDIIHGKLGNFAVRWSEYIGAFVAGISTKIMPCLNRGTMKCYEVVGNIHDNPELLESDIYKAETAESE